ncbi:carbohydrate porin [Planctomycetota bacterium]
MSARTVIRVLVVSLMVSSLSVMSGVCLAEESDQGILPVPDYSGDFQERSHLTGDWGGTRQDWAQRGILLDFGWYQAYQDIVNGGASKDSANSTNLDYRLTLDLARMNAVPGAIVNVRGQSRFGSTVNEQSGLLLPVNMYSYFPYGSTADEDITFTITEFNWTQFLAENFGLLAGKITTLGTANEFMGGEGRSQFMNFQFNFPAVVAQLAPYSTLAVSAFWLPSENWTITTTFMNLQDASTTSGFSDIGDGTTWATTADYLASLNTLPGGGSLGFYYGFDAEFAKIGGLNYDPSTGSASVESKSSSWGLTWSGWQYLFAEDSSQAVDPRNGRQDLQGLGLFMDLGFGDRDANPVTWTAAGGLSGRGSIPSRDDDTWGLGLFYNELQDLGVVSLESMNSGVEAYYDIALTGYAYLTLNAQWTKSGLKSVDNASILAARLNVRF